MAEDQQYLIAREQREYRLLSSAGSGAGTPPSNSDELGQYTPYQQTGGQVPGGQGYGYAAGYGSIPVTGEPHRGATQVTIQVEEARGVEITDDAETLPETTCFDSLCDVYSCHMNCCTEREDRGSQSRVLLRKARREGWWMVRCLILPHVLRREINLVWVLLQIVAALILTGLSIAAIIRLPESEYSKEWIESIVHVIAVGLWAILSFGDGVVVARHYSSDTVRVYSAIARVIYSAICLYVAVVADLAYLKLNVGKHPVFFARSFCTVVCFAGFVHLVVIGLTGRAIAVVNKLSNKDPSKTMGNSARNFLIRFLVNLLSQSLVQVVTLVTIGQRVQGSSFDTYTWTILVIGFMMPAVGAFMYFVTNLYWVQEFLIGTCTTVLCIASEPGSYSGNYLEWLRPNDNQRQSLEQLKETIDLDMLKSEATHMLNKKTTDKIILPFQSPVAVLLCIAFIVPIAFFASFTVVHNRALTGNDNWLVFYYASIGIYGLVNLYPVVTGGIWILVVVIAFVFLLLILVFLRRLSRYLFRDGCDQLCVCCQINMDTIG